MNELMLLQFFSECFSTANDFWVEVFPKQMDGVVVCQFRCSDAILNSFFGKSSVIFFENNGMNSFVLIVWMYSNEIKCYVFAMVSSV